jgi:hypothetical protein
VILYLFGRISGRENRLSGYTIRPLPFAEHSRLNDHLQNDKSSERSEGVPAFGLPLFFLGFLISRFNGSNHASSPFCSVSRLLWYDKLTCSTARVPVFLGSARFSQYSDISGRGAPESVRSQINLESHPIASDLVNDLA